jgi:hypothetical protein
MITKYVFFIWTPWTWEVVAIIKKLTPSWKELNNYLKHKNKEMRVEDFFLD